MLEISTLKISLLLVRKRPELKIDVCVPALLGGLPFHPSLEHLSGTGDVLDYLNVKLGYFSQIYFLD